MDFLDRLSKLSHLVMKQVVLLIAATSAILAGLLSLLVPDIVFGTRIFFPADAIIPAEITIMVLGIIGFLIFKALIFYKYPEWVIGKE